MTKRATVIAALMMLLASIRPAEPRQAAGETLYNGIQLPSVWPPRPSTTPVDPVTPAYLTNPPAVIPIDVGRQLFVDDFLIAETTLARTYHPATYHPGNPVLSPDRAWEKPANGAFAAPFSDGMLWDPEERKFKMWYLGGYIKSTCYATSPDGITWEKPLMDVVPGTNIVRDGTRDSGSVWRDPQAVDPNRRYVHLRCYKGGATVPDAYGLFTHFSADGIHWSEPPRLSGSCGDRSTLFYNPFRKVWVYSLRHGWSQPRKRRYWETRDLVNGPMWHAIDEPPWWCAADSADRPRPDIGTTPELYNLDCVPYESVMLGLFNIWYGHLPNRPKINEVQVAYSRDGWNWVRPDRRPFCGVSEIPGSWNWGNIQSVANGLFVMGDELWFYVSGRKGDGTNIDAGGSTGLAKLRRDGFASMDADAVEGSLTTRPLRFSGRHLFVNVDAPAGELRVEALDSSGQVLAPYTKSASVPVSTNRTMQEVTWSGAADLGALSGRDVKFRFLLRSGRLYSFWVSPDPNGASNGYVGAGGPAFTGPVDTVGNGNPPAASPSSSTSSRSSSENRCGCGSVNLSQGPSWILAIPLVLAMLAVLKPLGEGKGKGEQMRKDLRLNAGLVEFARPVVVRVNGRTLHDALVEPASVRVRP